MVALRVIDLCFWPAKTRKNMNVLRCIHVFGLVLKSFAEMNEGNRLQLLFYFIVLMGIVALVIWLSFSYLGFGCFRLKFSSIALSRKRLQLDSESDVTTTGLFLESFVWLCLVLLTPYLHIVKLSGIVELFFLFWRHQVFSIASLKGSKVCSLIFLVFCSHRIFEYRLISFSIAVQLYFLIFCVFQSSCPGSCVELSLWLLLQLN